MPDRHTFSLNNKWTDGKSTWGRISLPEYAFRQACVLPIYSILEPKVGSETILLLIDPTDFIHDLAALKPFQLYLDTGLVNTDFGPVAFFIYQVKRQATDEPFAVIEQTLNPLDHKMLAPYHNLAHQTHWHVFLIDKNGDEVHWYEFENNFRVAEALEGIDRATKDMHCTDFNQAKTQYNTMYTLDELIEMTKQQ